MYNSKRDASWGKKISIHGLHAIVKLPLLNLDGALFGEINYDIERRWIHTEIESILNNKGNNLVIVCFYFSFEKSADEARKVKQENEKRSKILRLFLLKAIKVIKIEEIFQLSI